MDGPTDTWCFLLLVWGAELRFAQGTQRSFDAHGSRMENHHLTTHSPAPLLVERRAPCQCKSRYGQFVSLEGQQPLYLPQPPPTLPLATATPQILPSNTIGHAEVLHQSIQKLQVVSQCLHSTGNGGGPGSKGAQPLCPHTSSTHQEQ